MRDRLAHADQLRRDGSLSESQMLEGVDLLGGFNLIDAKDMNEVNPR